MHVVVVVLQRFFDRFANCLETGKVHDRADAMVGKQAVQYLRIAHVTFDKFWPPGANGGQALKNIHPTVAQIVEDEHIVPGLHQHDAGMRTNVAGTTGDENHGGE